MREFVKKHPEYEHDSRVGEGVVYDLLKKVVEVEETSSAEARVGWEMLGGMATADADPLVDGVDG